MRFTTSRDDRPPPVDVYGPDARLLLTHASGTRRGASPHDSGEADQEYAESHDRSRDVPRLESGAGRRHSGYPLQRSNVNVLILAKDEERNLPHALASVAWADAVHVVDSGSSDATRDIARRAGARVVDRPWLGFASQKNWALDNL